MDDVVGALMDEGYSPQEVREMVGPMMVDMDENNESDLGSHVLDLVHPATDQEAPTSGREQVVRAVLTQARDSRQPPGPRVVVPSGVVHSMPESGAAEAVRVDTEDSYRAWRAGGTDQPKDDVEHLDRQAQAELMGDFERGYASQLIGNIMDMQPASATALHDDPHVSVDQSCVMCGVNSGSVVCENCVDRLPTMLGLFERGYASQVIGLFERGAAASMHDDNPSTHGYDYDTGDVEYDTSVLGSDAEEFYRLQRMNEGGSSVVGQDGFYRLPRHQPGAGGRSPTSMVGDDFYRLPRHSIEAGGLSSFIGDVMALAVPSTVYAEQIPLSFHRHDQRQNIAGWKQGDRIFGSIRVTGWDGQPRILTGTTPYVKEVGIVVGYSTSASIPPTQTIAIIDPLARQLGASRILPRLAAAAPAVLRVSSDKLSPLVMTAMPAHKGVHGSWI